LKKAINTLLSLGIEDSQSSYDRRRIKTINLINLLVIFFLLIGFTNYFILKTDFAFGASLTFLTLSIFSLWLNKIRLNNFAFFLFTFNVNLAILFVNEYYPVEVGSYLFYFPLIVSVVLLNNPNLKDKRAILHFVTCIIFFASSLLIDAEGYRLSNLQPEQMKVLWYYNLLMSASLTATLSFLLTRIIYSQNKEIIAQNEDLIKTKEVVNVSLKEKEILLAELHHRVKNNLAIISGLLNLQEDSTSNEEAKKIIGDSKTRIMSMALVHKMLYENNELKSINISKYASELIYELFNSYNLLKTVSINEDYDAIAIPVNKSIPLGLILNEIVTNSIKYAFKSSKDLDGVFDISIKNENNTVRLLVKDNGHGFPKDFNIESDNHSLGIFLIKTLAEQIDATVTFSNETGAKIELNFSHS
jgi:two-component sensor histidine kinase